MCVAKKRTGRAKSTSVFCIRRGWKHVSHIQTKWGKFLWVLTSMHCLKACNSETRCQTINQLMGKEICELDNWTKEANPVVLIQEDTRRFDPSSPLARTFRWWLCAIGWHMKDFVNRKDGICCGRNAIPERKSHLRWEKTEKRGATPH